jgi:hypothetical protein
MLFTLHGIHDEELLLSYRKVEELGDDEVKMDGGKQKRLANTMCKQVQTMLGSKSQQITRGLFFAVRVRGMSYCCSA